MLRFTVRLDETDNAAFRGNGLDEVHNILQTALDRWRSGYDSDFDVFDANGNRVGEATIRGEFQGVIL